MSFSKSETAGGLGDDKINSHYKGLLSQYKKTMNSSGEDVRDLIHSNPAGGTPSASNGPMKSPLMNWTQMLEAMDEISNSMVAQSPENDIGNENIEDGPSGDIEPDDKDLLGELNKIFTPVLVMQGLEEDIADKANAELSEASVLNEKTMITFDESARMAQLISVCSLLIAKKKNTEKWQMFKKAAAIKRQTKLDIQKEEYGDAKALAQKYLVMVSTSNNSSIARDAANSLLPETQH